MFLTVEGIQMDERDEQPQNTESPRDERLDPDSNPIIEREEQL
jgi:hypothetical protein